MDPTDIYAKIDVPPDILDDPRALQHVMDDMRAFVDGKAAENGRYVTDMFGNKTLFWVIKEREDPDPGEAETYQWPVDTKEEADGVTLIAWWHTELYPEGADSAIQTIEGGDNATNPQGV